MLSKDVLLNQKVIFRDDASPLMIVGVNEFNNIKDVKITLENNKTLVLFLAFSNGFLNFVDENIQNQVAQEIETFNEKQKQDELKREETQKEAMQIAVKRANKINELKQVKKRNKSNPNVRKDKKNVAIKATYCDNGE